jgi:hypothetical protein
MITTRHRSGAIPKLTEAQTTLSLFSNVALILQTIGLIIENVCKQVKVPKISSKVSLSVLHGVVSRLQELILQARNKH